MNDASNLSPVYGNARPRLHGSPFGHAAGLDCFTARAAVRGDVNSLSVPEHAHDATIHLEASQATYGGIIPERFTEVTVWVLTDNERAREVLLPTGLQLDGGHE